MKSCVQVEVDELNWRNYANMYVRRLGQESSMVAAMRSTMRELEIECPRMYTLAALHDRPPRLLVYYRITIIAVMHSCRMVCEMPRRWRYGIAGIA